MKRLFFFCLIGLGFSLTSQAQNPDNNFLFSPNQMASGLPRVDSLSQFSGTAGYMRIGDQDFIGLRIRPEISLFKFGVGLDIPLIFNLKDGTLRKEEFENGVGWLRLIRYVRYGMKRRDPVYLRAGDISNTYLGFGILVNNYSNNTSFERRKMGLAYDFKISNKWGVEGFYNDFDLTSFNLNGIRPYYKPFGGSSLPILKNLEFGASLVTDFDKTKTATSDSTFKRSVFTSESGMWAGSVDVGTYLVNSKMITLTAYAQAASIFKNTSDSLARFVQANNLSYGTGMGASVGVSAQFRLIANVLTLQARLERNWHGKNFIPQFFDIAYEVNRDARIRQLALAEASNGTFGRLDAQILEKILVLGGLYIPDNVSITSPGMIQLSTQLPKIGPVTVNASYIKSGLTGFGDAFTFDERSQAFARFSYNLGKYFITGLEYRWTFAKMENGAFKATSFVSPFFSLNIPFNLNRASNPNTITPN